MHLNKLEWFTFSKFLRGSKIFTSKACGLYYKSFTIVIYDCNDSTIIEPLLWKLNYDQKALASAVNYYDRKLLSKLKHNLLS